MRRLLYSRSAFPVRERPTKRNRLKVRAAAETASTRTQPIRLALDGALSTRAEGFAVDTMRPPSFGRLHDRAEALGVMHRDICQHLAVQGDPGALEPRHQPAVANA